jgi:hypothetical protein
VAHDAVVADVRGRHEVAVVADYRPAVGLHRALDLAELAEDVAAPDPRCPPRPPPSLDLRVETERRAEPHHVVLAELQGPHEAGVRADPRPRADRDAVADHGVGPDLHVGREARARIDDGGRVDAHHVADSTVP